MRADLQALPLAVQIQDTKSKVKRGKVTRRNRNEKKKKEKNRIHPFV